MLKIVRSSSKIFLLSLSLLAWGCGQGSDPSTNNDTNPNGKADDGNSVTKDAPTTVFTCTTTTPEDGQTATITFTVSNFVKDPNAKGEMEFVWPEDEDKSCVTVEPDVSSVASMMWGMADGGIYYADGKLEVTSDGDGCDMGDLVLYEDSRFEKGYVRMEFHCSEDNSGFYSEVSCQLNPPIR
jgi:hypothetical protein